MNGPFPSATPITLGRGASDMISISEILSAITERRIMILSSAAVCALLAFLYVTSIVDTYTASSSIMLAPQRERVLGSEEIIPSLKPDEMLISTQIELLESRSIAEIVVETLDLENDPLWNGERQPKAGIPAAFSSLIGGSQTVVVPAEMRRLNAVEKVMAQTGAVQIRGSLVLSIWATDYEPSRAAEMANALRDAYIGSEMSISGQVSSRASSWFQSRLDTLERELKEQERAVAQFRESNGLIVASGSTLTEQQVLDSQGSVAAARSELLEKEARLNQILEASASTDRLAEIGLAVGSTQIAELRKRESEISAKLADISTQYGPAHPELLSTQAEISDVRGQIQKELGRIIKTTQDDVAVARSRLRLAERDRSGYESRLAQNNEALVRLRQLERDAEATKETYEDYLRRFQEVNDQASLDTTPVRIVSTAVAPFRPDTPSLALSLVAAMMVGGLLGTGAAFLLNAIDDRVRTTSDVRQKLGKPVLGLIPLQAPFSIRDTGNRDQKLWQWMLENKFSRFGEAFRVIQKYIYGNVGGEAQIIAISSAMPSEGKTTTAICLARSIALSGRRTLLIDCDTRVRGVTRAFESMDVSLSGIAAAIKSVGSISDIAVQDPKTPVHVIGCVESDKHVEDLFSSPGMADLLKRAALEYETILLDSPPVLALADAIAISALATKTLFVVRSNFIPSRLSRVGIEQIEEGGGRVAGIILNRVRANSFGLFASSDKSFFKEIRKSYYQG